MSWRKKGLKFIGYGVQWFKDVLTQTIKVITIMVDVESLYVKNGFIQAMLLWNGHKNTVIEMGLI